ncbi:MAG: hypothetical protein ACXWAT_11510 [Methylobacter sp.]
MNRSSQENAGRIHTKNRSTSFRYHGKEEGTAWNISTPKVGHNRSTKT